jgi:hypothetical protein
MKLQFIALSISLLPVLAYPQALELKNENRPNLINVTPDSHLSELPFLPPSYTKNGAIIIDYDHKPTGFKIYAKYDENKNITGDLILEGDSQIINLSPQTKTKIEEILNSTKFFDKKGSPILFGNTIQAMWMNTNGDVIVSQSTRYGVRLTAFQKNSSGSEIAICQGRINTRHSPQQ